MLNRKPTLAPLCIFYSFIHSNCHIYTLSNGVCGYYALITMPASPWHLMLYCFSLSSRNLQPTWENKTVHVAKCIRVPEDNYGRYKGATFTLRK